MYLTLINLSKKGKTVLVAVKSTASSNYMLMLRDKLAEKYEFIRYDPIVQQNVLYKEAKKIKTIGKSSKGED
jgi:ribosomal protein L33